jgi:acetylornithine deacetylase/succinyl-diaminopimelate desuccinylase-like protein
MTNFAKLGIVASLICAGATVAAAQVPTVDWKKQEAEILRHHRALVEIDTSPPSHETKVDDYLTQVLEAEGIPVKTFALDPARANLVARLKGNGTKRPILLMAHTDVVGVQREKWPMDPFGAIVKDGYIWGRGSIDCKDKLAANLMVMLLLKRTRPPLDRDVIFLAEAGEEGTTGPGIDFMVQQHFDAIDAEFALTEGGRVTIEDGRVTTVQVATTEKVPRRVRLVATGTSGHASIPRMDNALVHLAAAVAKVGTWQPPMRLNETTRTYFDKLAAISKPEKAERYRGLTDPARSMAIQRYLAEYEPQRDTMLRTSVVPTILKAGFRVNVIPSEAEATLDIRALPDEDIPTFLVEMQRVIGDPAVKIERIVGDERPVGVPSRLDTDMFRALERVSQQMYPGSTTLPTLLGAATDMAQLRAKGIQSYGIGPAATDEDQIKYGAHSDVERVLESSLYGLAEFTWRVVLEVAGSR